MALHGGALPEFMARYPRWTRKVLARADVLVAPSTFLARAVETYGFQARVIPNVIDLSCYEYRHRRSLSPRLFWMRAFDPIWNPMMAVRAFAKLHSTVPEATLVMGGEDKGQELEVRELAKTLGLNGAVRFSGFLEMPEKLREGSTADIFLNTNRIDNTPVSIIEACAMGLPVIAAKVGGIPDLIQDEETGLLVPDDDDDAMAAAIKRLLADESLAARLSENGRRVAERSSWTNVLPEWERLFAEIRTRPHGPSAD
jgi:glycosyltransferase involved in cell wall biosynthesis